LLPYQHKNTSQSALHGALKACEKKDVILKPNELYEIINNVLYELNKLRIKSDKFMTLNYFYEDNSEFTYAGTHEIALLYTSKEGKVIEIKNCASKTAFMGLAYNINAKESCGSFKMQKDDILLLYTDGLIEARDAESNQLGIEQLKEILVNEKI